MREIKTKLVGISFGERQANVPLVQTGFNLFWKREKDNPYDQNAILVFADPRMTKELGHIRASLAAELKESLEKGVEMQIIAERVTGTQPKQTYGLNVTIRLKE